MQPELGQACQWIFSVSTLQIYVAHRRQTVQIRVLADGMVRAANCDNQTVCSLLYYWTCWTQTPWSLRAYMIKFPRTSDASKTGPYYIAYIAPGCLTRILYSNGLKSYVKKHFPISNLNFYVTVWLVVSLYHVI